MLSSVSQIYSLCLYLFGIDFGFVCLFVMLCMYFREGSLCLGVGLAHCYYLLFPTPYLLLDMRMATYLLSVPHIYPPHATVYAYPITPVSLSVFFLNRF